MLHGEVGAGQSVDALQHYDLVWLASAQMPLALMFKCICQFMLVCLDPSEAAEVQTSLIPSDIIALRLLMFCVQGSPACWQHF